MDEIAYQTKVEILKKMPFQEKWAEVLKLRELAWSLKSAALKMQSPEKKDAEIYEEVKKIFLYANS